MATTTTVSSNYAGKVAGSIIGKSFKEGDTLGSGIITEVPNVNFKMNLRKIQYTNGTTNYSCGFTPEGAVVLSEKVLEVKKLMNPFQICKEEFRQTWSEDSMGQSASNPNMPADILEAMQMQVLGSQAEKVDNDIWNGTDVDGSFAGFISQFTADGNVVKANNGITALNAATTEANVEAHLKAALSAVPIALRGKQLEVLVAPNVFQAYSFYLVSKGIAWNGTTDEKRIGFGNYMLTKVNGLAADTIVVYEKSNLVFATGSTSDFNELTLIDEDSIGLLTGQVRGKMVYAASVGYYNSEDIVWLLTTTA